jgi:tetratricopeptide (TPR) repeat protein
VSDRCEALLRLLRQTPRHDVRERRRDVVLARFVAEYRAEDLCHGGSIECATARECLVEHSVEDIFAIQDDIASAIAAALRVRLSTNRRAGRHVPNVAAYDAVLKGRYLMLKHLAPAMARGREHFASAIQLDPLYAEPHAQLGLADLLSAMMGACALRDVAGNIRSRAEQALSLAPADPGPHFLLGAVAAAHEFAWEEAAHHFATALGGRSTTAEAHWAYASLYLQPLGRFRQAVDHMQEAVSRDPLNMMWRGVLVSTSYPQKWIRPRSGISVRLRSVTRSLSFSRPHH